MLYIHIPFCESKCPYCAFGSVVGQRNLTSDYFGAMMVDLRDQLAKFKIKKNEIKSVFIGGGTPSVIEAKFYEPIFAEISPFLSKKCEITSEANPNSANLKWLKSMRNLGVNRVSFGAQSFFEDKLKLLGRTHDKEQIYKAVKNAKIAGFKNINVDLIYDTKLDTKKRLSLEVQNLKSLKINHVSAYSLSLEAKTPFERKFEYKKDSPRLAIFLINELNSAGFKQYEISNFGKICRHNLGYWQGKNYLAIGAYAVGFYKNMRFYNARDIKKYILAPLKKEIEILGKKELNLEQIFLGARSKIGINALNLDDEKLKRAEILRKAKKLTFKNNRYYVKNFLLADEIALFIEG